MATNNITFPIYNADGTPFNGLVLHNATFDSVVMSLGDKITGDVYYRDNTLAVTMSEYIEYRRNEDSEVVRFVLVNPPTVVREGIVSDNSELHGMTKYSFVFYHPMCAVSNFPFTDVAVSSDEQKYLSNSKTFNWIGNLFDMVAKLNKNLQGTQWVVGTNIEHYEQDGVTETSMWQKAVKIPDEPLSFDKTYVSEVLKTSYETWEIPFVIDQIATTDARYAQGKRFLILFGTPSNEILDDQGEPYIFRFGQGVGLKNNSRTPKNNKIVTRIVGYGSENNIPFGYPQIQWFGDQTWKYTVNNDLSAEGSLPIYKGILGGQYVNLIKHPFTRKTLMPSVYRETLFNKVSPYMPDGTPNPNFDPTIELVDYYDADNSYVNPAVEGAESVEIHQFEDIKPEFTEHSIVDAFAYDREHEEAISYATFIERMDEFIVNAINENEKVQLTLYRDSIDAGMTYSDEGEEGGSYTWHRNLNIVDEYYMRVRYTSDSANFNWLVVRKNTVVPATQWDDTMDDDGNYKQSYFKITLPQLDFDLYACASITEEMKINMRSGACIGCTFDIAVDWDDYKKNFYDSDGNFLPDGEQRDLTKYPKTNLGQVTLVVKKDLDTFGTLMPNTYQQPHSGDKFVILGISLPITYVTNAEARLDDAAKEYMRENNVHYYEYPLKFDEHFLATNTDILSQIRNNTIVRFQYGGELPMALYVKQITVKYSGVLPTYDITLTDDIEIVLNQIGQVTDDVSRMRVQVSELQKYYSENIIQAINEKLSKVVDDVCQGRITFQQGLDSIGSAIFHDELRSPDFTSGLYTGRGWRVDQLGNAEFESVRARSFLEVVELLVNRLQAQEGDTIFSDNDQIERVDKDTDETTGNISYVLSLKEKWQGYVTSQQEGNILCGIINTLAAKGAGVSDEENNNPQKQGSDDGGNKYYTSWMYVVATHNEENSLGLNQIRVVLYGDNEVPAGKNFEPCELMAIARRGCIDYADPQSEDYQQVLASIKRRQQLFYLSTSEGRIVKLTGVNKPKLEAGNYGTTLGIVPDFVKQWAIADRLIDGRDYLYAQGVIVGDFIKVDIQGNPVVTFVDKGEWQNNTEYLYSEYNQVTLQYETHEVWHNGSLWRVKQHQPVVSGGVSTYYEPTDNNSAYWQKLMSSGDSTRQIYSYSSSSPVVPQQYEQDDEYNPSGWSNTPLALSQQHKDVYISTRKKHNGTWGQWSTPVLFSHLAEDGTSIAIKGSAYSVITSSSELPSQPSSDTICLWNDTNVDDYEQYVLYDYQQQLYHWEGFGCDVGDGFIVNGDLWVKTTDTPTADNQRWANVGRIKGDKGDDGKNTATVFIYKRFASQPTSTDKPTATLTYSFANGSLSGNLNGWSAIIPQSDGNPCWVRQVFVSSDSPTVTITPTSWSTANKYTEDGKNGVSIEAQYSPDTIQIHTTWQTGDLYMRTRATNEASWSDWQRIVGENGANGDYTDYSFGISALLKTASPTTAPSDISDSDWADAPVETTEQKPYLWSRVIKYVWVNGVKTVESTTYIRLTGEQGQQGIRGEQGAQGETGQRGKVGRFFYYAGKFNSANIVDTFIVNDAQAPYFEHTENGQKRYHVFNYDTNGTYTMAQMWAASQQSWNNAPWEVMTNDFKYLITEAIFASFAHFGSAIISGDWTMSCFGIIYDTNGGTHVINSKSASWTSGGVTYNYNNAYTLFDADYPNESKPNALNFVPYYCVDMLAGAVYQQNAFVKGTIEASSGHIGGFIINGTQIKSSDNSNNITLNSDGTAKLGVLSITASGTSITGDLTVSSTSGMYFKLRPSTTSDASISAYNSSGKEMVKLGINSFSRPSLFLGVPSSGQDYKMTTRIDPEQISLWGLFGTSEYLSTLDNGLEYLGSISNYYAQTGSNTWKMLQVGIRNSAVMLKAVDENGGSAWPEASRVAGQNGHTAPNGTSTNTPLGEVRAIGLEDLRVMLATSSQYYGMMNNCGVLLVRMT